MSNAMFMVGQKGRMEWNMQQHNRSSAQVGSPQARKSESCEISTKEGKLPLMERSIQNVEVIFLIKESSQIIAAEPANQ